MYMGLVIISVMSRYSKGRDSLSNLARCPGALHGIHARIWQLLLELVTAVDAIHGLGMIHMDLKSENVLLTCKRRQGHVKLADMGVAQTDDAMMGDDEKRPEVVEQRIKDRRWASPEELGVLFKGERPVCLLFRLLCFLTCRAWQKRL